MNIIRPVLAALALASACSLSLFAQAPAAAPAAAPVVPVAPTRASPHETINGRPPGGMITITYGRPYAKNRKVYGGLVKWEQPDRLGADEATSLITQVPLTFGETTIPVGVYTLYIVPSENGVSKLAFSSALGKWGIPVDTSKDVARIDLKKEAIETHVEQLTIGVQRATDGGTLVIAWEKTKFSAPFTVKK